METFEEFRTQFIEDCKRASACEPEFRKLLASETKADVLKVIKDNIYWCFEQKVLNTPKLLDAYTADELKDADIYTSGKHSINLSGTDIRNIVTLGSSRATVKTCDSSQATVKTCDSSQATVETLDSSRATVKTWDSSQATVETWDSSRATV